MYPPETPGMVWIGETGKRLGEREESVGEAFCFYGPSAPGLLRRHGAPFGRFQFPTSAFQLPPSAFRLPSSVFQQNVTWADFAVFLAFQTCLRVMGK